MMHEDDDTRNATETLLNAAAKEKQEVPDDLFSRVLSDAALEQDRILQSTVDRDGRAGLWAQIRNTLGGWPVLGGLAATSCAGFWIGINLPEGIPDAGELLLGGAYYSDLDAAGDLIGFGWVLEEG